MWTRPTEARERMPPPPPLLTRASRGPPHPSPSPLDAVAPRVDVPATHVAGTRPGLHGHTLVSSGLADLDNLLGGGVPLGTVVVLGTDGDPSSAGGNACTLLRYFVAEGCASGHAGMWIHPGGGGARAGSGGSRSVARTLPRVVVDKARADDDDDDDGSARRDANGDANGDGLRIAWQYRRYLRQGKALDDGRVGGARDGLGAGLSTSGGGGGVALSRAKRRRRAKITRDLPPVRPHARERPGRCGRRGPHVRRVQDLTRAGGSNAQIESRRRRRLREGVRTRPRAFVDDTFAEGRLKRCGTDSDSPRRRHVHRRQRRAMPPSGSSARSAGSSGARASAPCASSRPRNKAGRTQPCLWRR